MKEPTIYRFADYVGRMREVFLVRSEYEHGGLRVMFVARLGDHWEEWRDLTVCIHKLDERRAYLNSWGNDEFGEFLKRHELARPTGESFTEDGISRIGEYPLWEYPLYEFTDKFFDEALILAND